LCKSRSAMAPPPLGGTEPPSLPQGPRHTRRHVQIHFIDVTPGPSLAGLERGHYRMGRVREMFGGMAIGRAVATPDVATSQTETKMNPGRSNFQAFFTACSASSHGLNRSRVWTGHESPPGLKNNHTRVSFLHDRNPRCIPESTALQHVRQGPRSNRAGASSLSITITTTVQGAGLSQTPSGRP
jgi:hypothetical protein